VSLPFPAQNIVTQRNSCFFSLPITRLLIISFISVALIPVIVLGFKLYQAAWEDAWREITEKHQLLAHNLAAPISIYINDHRAALTLVATSLERQIATGDTLLSRPTILQDAGQQLPGFRALYLIAHNGELRYSNRPLSDNQLGTTAFANEQCFIKTREQGKWALSGVKASPIDGSPTITMSQPVRNRQGKTAYVLLGELKTTLIEQLRSQIRFGKQGHSAIVDQFGHVVAHPNPGWMKEMHDLSDLPIVKQMMAGKSGVTEFFSPFIKANMVAGYAAVPNIGWGIMVPQPKSEVEANVSSLLYAEFGWGLLGLGFAFVISIALARWITRPLNHLAQAAIQLNKTGFKGHLPLDQACRMPREVRTLTVALDNLVRGLQTSNDKIEQLNQSLQHRVEEATSELRQTNRRLAEVAQSDYLTSLANRRHFEDSLAKNLIHRRANDASLCLIFIDVDHFKAINDTYGHAAGDVVLRELAAVLLQSTRDNDMVARYAGDEFIIKMHCEQEVGFQRANAVMQAIQQHPFEWEGERLQVSVSMGLLSHHASQDEDTETLMQRLDKALYEAKQSGRNRLVVYEA